MENTKQRTLDQDDIVRLQKLCGLFSSDQPGERANAAAMADRFLRDRGLRWPDVLTAPGLPPPADAWRETVAACRARPDRITAWEKDFLSEIATYRNPPSGRQAEILARIFAKIRAP
jgi:hypothetical protein